MIRIEETRSADFGVKRKDDIKLDETNGYGFS
jgi:hypothetical protein